MIDAVDGSGFLTRVPLHEAAAFELNDTPGSARDNDPGRPTAPPQKENTTWLSS